MRTRLRLIPLDELVFEPGQEIRQFAPLVDKSIDRSDPAPRVIVTADKHVIAGRAYLNAYRLVGYGVIPCRIVAEDEIDTLLTSIHNKILYHEPLGEGLLLQLELYAELCLYRQTRSARPESGSRERPPGTEPPQG
jgi:hypothetical protein